MILEGTSLKVTGVLVAAASITTGILEIFAAQSTILGPMNLLAGGILAIALWFGHRIAKIAERYIEGLGEKVIALPSKAELDRDKKSLMDALAEFSEGFETERKETAKFREQLANTLGDHTARLTNLERKLL